MVRPEEVMFSAACAAVLGGFWGVGVGLVYPVAGLCVGGGLFLLTFLVLLNKCWMADEADAKNLGLASLPEENV
jgi:hypothetical protein